MVEWDLHTAKIVDLRGTSITKTIGNNKMGRASEGEADTVGVEEEVGMEMVTQAEILEVVASMVNHSEDLDIFD